MTNHIAPYVFPIIAVALLIWRAGRTRKVRVGIMWIYPVVFVALAGVALFLAPAPGIAVIAGYGTVALIGGVFGYLRVRHTTLSIDPQTGDISSQSTALGAAILIALFAIRFGVRQMLPQGAGHHGVAVMEATNALLIFTAAMFATQCVFLLRRLKPLRAAHAEARAPAPPE